MSSLGKAFGIGCFWLVATASALGVANPAGTDGPQTAPSDDPTVAQSEQPPSGNPLWRIPLKQLSATRDRPIFSPSRRPRLDAPAPVAAVVRPPPPAPKPPERPQLSLVGTIVHGDDGFAIFVDQSTNAPLRIRMGADYQGWMLRQIEAKSVTLQKGEDVAVLAFPELAKVQNNPAAAVFANPPAPPPPLAATAPATPPYLSPESNALRMPPRPRASAVRVH